MVSTSPKVLVNFFDARFVVIEVLKFTFVSLIGLVRLVKALPRCHRIEIDMLKVLGVLDKAGVGKPPKLLIFDFLLRYFLQFDSVFFKREWLFLLLGLER